MGLHAVPSRRAWRLAQRVAQLWASGECPRECTAHVPWPRGPRARIHIRVTHDRMEMDKVMTEPRSQTRTQPHIDMAIAHIWTLRRLHADAGRRDAVASPCAWACTVQPSATASR